QRPTLPPRRTLLLCSWSGERRRGKVYVVRIKVESI
ncbi:hypothetical protein AAKU58_004284, partial [Oxalobacteraceae bacterium GrIS 1.18]